MEKNIIFLLLSMVLILTSCTTESVKPQPTVEPIQTDAPAILSAEPPASNSAVTLADEEQNEDVQEHEYIGNINSKKFHYPSCYVLPAEKNRIYFNSRNKAIQEGYTPCGNCLP